MDIIKQNKLISLTLILLVILNITTVSTLWLRYNINKQVISPSSSKNSNQTVKLMQEEINLSTDQADKFNEMHKSFLENTKIYNDELNNLKGEIAEEIFRQKPNDNKVDSLALKIGLLQSKVEVVKYKHFLEFSKICNDEQKKKLQPILKEVFSKKPVKDKRIPDPPKKENKTEQQSVKQETQKGPSVDERLERISNKLFLTNEQKSKVGKILQASRTKIDNLKKEIKRDDPEFEIKKDKLQDEEEANIMKLLSWEQKEELKKIIDNRKNRRNR